MTQEIHRHSVPDRDEDDWKTEQKCSECGKTTQEMRDDVNDEDPTTRRSQQPMGKSTLYCNMCQMYVVPTSFGGETNICPYHQRVSRSEEGEVEFMYDEFDQDGN